MARSYWTSGRPFRSLYLFKLIATVYFSYSSLLSNTIIEELPSRPLEPLLNIPSYLMNHSRTLNLSGVSPLPSGTSHILGLALEAENSVSLEGICIQDLNVRAKAIKIREDISKLLLC